ncbi:MAG: hypothetical protein FWD53_06050 [Phycisphaerales bacterium]|nr:hypothetical protein [Phycisphaerales bacterium]
MFRRFKIVAVLLCSLSLVAALFLWWRFWQGSVALGSASATNSRVEANDNINSSSSVIRQSNARFVANRIWLRPQGNNVDHLLLKKIVEQLKDSLAADSQVEEVRVAERWEQQGPGGGPEVLPDLTIRIRLDNLNESSSLTARTLELDLKLDLSSSVVSNNYGYTDESTPPTARISWNAVLQHRSTSTGDGVGAARYQLTSKHLADKVAEDLKKQFAKWREDNGTLPDIPPEFVLPYTPLPTDLNFLSTSPFSATRLITGNGLLLHNRTVWTWQDSRPANEVLDDLVARLGPESEKGWRVIDRSPKPDRPEVLMAPNLRMWRDRCMIQAFVEPSEALNPTTISPTTSPTTWYLSYDDRASQVELTAIWQKLINQDQWRETARLFAFVLPSAIREQYFTRLESLSDKAADEWLALTEYYHYTKKETPQALHALACAAILDDLDTKPSLAARITELAKKLGDEELPKRPPDPALFRDLNIQTLNDPDTPRTVSVSLGQIAAVVYQQDAISHCIIASQVTANPQNLQLYCRLRTTGTFATPITLGSATGGTPTPTGWHAFSNLGNDHFDVRVDAKESTPPTTPQTFNLTFTLTKKR